MKHNKLNTAGIATTIEAVPEGVDPIEFLKQQMDDCPLCREARARGEAPELHRIDGASQQRTGFRKRPRWRTMKRRR